MNLNQRHITDRLHPSEERWFALRTANRHEKRAVGLLEKSGVKYFLPLQSKRKAYASKTVIRECCLLPGYVFVHITRADLPAIYANSYVNFLTIGRERLDIPAEEIEVLRRIVGEKEMALEWELQPFTEWKTGQRVELIGGHLTGLQGIYLSNQNKGQLLISLGLLPPGMGLQTTVPANMVRPLGQPVSIEAAANT